MEVLAYGLYLAAVGWVGLRPGPRPVAAHLNLTEG